MEDNSNEWIAQPMSVTSEQVIEYETTIQFTTRAGLYCLLRRLQWITQMNLDCIIGIVINMFSCLMQVP